MGDEPFFSVVIPTYNRGGLILKTLNTVLAQTYQNYEIIVIDDCSTDNTEQILGPLTKAEKIRYLKHDHNYERAQARNTGMENARGDFVTLLDSDDLMYPNNLEDAAQYLRSHPQAKLFHSLHELVDEDGRVLCRHKFPPLTDPLLAITRGNFLSCAGVFMHRDIYQNYSFDTNPIAIGIEDWDFWLRVVPDFRPGRIKKINSGIVHHGNRSINRLELSRLHWTHAYLIDKFSNDSRLSSVYGKHLQRLEAGSLLYRSTFANLMRQHGEALRCLFLAAGKDFRMIGSVNFIKAFGIAVLRWDKGY